jgi:hypothetical protein
MYCGVITLLLATSISISCGLHAQYIPISKNVCINADMYTRGSLNGQSYFSALAKVTPSKRTPQSACEELVDAWIILVISA